MNIPAFHVFYQKKDLISERWDFINYLVQFASIIHWKKFYGPIHLYCNSDFVEKIKFYNLYDLYDSVNVVLLDELEPEKLSKFWSFCKILAIRDISETYEKFAVLDLDLWFKKKVDFDINQDLIGYHFENISDHPLNPYISPENFIDTQNYDFDWSTQPMNCAFLFFNSKLLIDLWVSISEEIVNSSDTECINNISSDTIFIEQRLLVTIARKLDLNYQTIIENVYYPEVEVNDLGLEWTPRIGYCQENLEITSRIKHVWGLKKRYDDIKIRELVLNVCLISLDENFPNWPDQVPKLVEQVWQLKKQGNLTL
jgi:hypothetical protein